MEERVGASVQVVAGDDFIARTGEGQQRKRDGRLSRGDGQPPHASFERGDPSFQDIGCRILQACVDVAEFLQRKQIRGLFGAFEDIGSGLINRHRREPVAGSAVSCPVCSATVSGFHSFMFFPFQSAVIRRQVAVLILFILQIFKCHRPHGLRQRGLHVRPHPSRDAGAAVFALVRTVDAFTSRSRPSSVETMSHTVIRDGGRASV